MPVRLPHLSRLSSALVVMSILVVVLPANAEVESTAELFIIYGVPFAKLEGQVEEVIHDYGSFVLVRARPLELRFLIVQGASFEPMAPYYKLFLNGEIATQKGLDLGELAGPLGQGYFIVQFVGPISQEWLRELTRLRVLPLYDLPNFAYVVKATHEAIRGVAHLSFVHTVGRYLREYAMPSDAGSDGWWLIRLHEPWMTTAFSSGLREQGVLVGGLIADRGIIEVSASRPEVWSIASSESVAAVLPVDPPRLFNEKAIPLSGAPSMWDSTWFGSRFRGQGQTVAIYDSGIDNGLLDSRMHDDVEGRIVSIEEHSNPLLGCVPDGPEDKFSGHGTHAIGMILGNGANSGGLLAGIAPEAQVVFHAVETTGPTGGEQECFPPISAIYNEYLEDYNAGVRVWSNSWGSPASGAYGTYSPEIDRFVWDHPDAVVVFSAGNGGTDVNSPYGRVDPDSLASPGTSKNVIVG